MSSVCVIAAFSKDSEEGEWVFDLLFPPIDPPSLLHARLYCTQVCCHFQCTNRKTSSFFLLWSLLQGFEAEWLYTGEHFGRVLTTLLAVNFATQGRSRAFHALSAL